MGGHEVNDLGEEIHATPALSGGRICVRAGARSTVLASSRVPCPVTFFVTCPYCGGTVEIFVEPDVHGSFVQDCEVCCNPWLVRSGGGDTEDERVVSVGRADGSD